VLLWNGAALALDSDVTLGFTSVNAQLAQKQEALTVANGLTLTGATLGCPAIQHLAAGASGLSLATGTGASQRVACYEAGSQYFYGTGLFEGSPAGLGVGLGLWGGTGASTPDQFGTGGVLPQVLITFNNTVGINHRLPSEALTVGGNILATGNISCAGNISCTGTMSAGVKPFVIDHPTKAGQKLRHWCRESDAPGGCLDYARQITATKAGVYELIMPDWFPAISKNVLVFCSPFRQMGTAWGEQSEDDPRIIHIHTSRGGVFNVLIMADRADHCAISCDQEVEFTPKEAPPPENSV